MKKQINTLKHVKDKLEESPEEFCSLFCSPQYSRSENSPLVYSEQNQCLLGNSYSHPYRLFLTFLTYLFPTQYTISSFLFQINYKKNCFLTKITTTKNVLRSDNKFILITFSVFIKIFKIYHVALALNTFQCLLVR
jgi:hypothetical protein